MTPFDTVVAEKLTRQGYEVLSSGWPDFCAIKKTGDGVEVRFIDARGRGDLTHPDQKKLVGVLQMLGIEVELIQEDVNHRMEYPPDVVAGIRVVKRHLSGRPAVVRQTAIQFLRENLKTGPKPAYELSQLADSAGISRATLYRTARDMGVVKKTAGWALPVVHSEEKNNVSR